MLAQHLNIEPSPRETRKHEVLTQCRFLVGPTSVTLANCNSTLGQKVEMWHYKKDNISKKNIATKCVFFNLKWP